MSEQLPKNNKAEVIPIGRAVKKKEIKEMELNEHIEGEIKKLFNLLSETDSELYDMDISMEAEGAVAELYRYFENNSDLKEIIKLINGIVVYASDEDRGKMFLVIKDSIAEFRQCDGKSFNDLSSGNKESILKLYKAITSFMSTVRYSSGF